MSENTVLAWTQDTYLKWSDFEAESNPAVFEDSCSTIKYRFTWTVNSDKIDDQIMFLIENVRLHVEFHPLLSWVRESRSSDQLLKHEQGNFDLAELVKQENLGKVQEKFYLRHFHTRGQNNEQRKQFAKEDSGRIILDEIEELERLLGQRRCKYQDETSFGDDLKEQSKYNDLFERLRS